jgi:hypothetical protein
VLKKSRLWISVHEVKDALAISYLLTIDYNYQILFVAVQKLFKFCNVEYTRKPRDTTLCYVINYGKMIMPWVKYSYVVKPSIMVKLAILAMEG